MDGKKTPLKREGAADDAEPSDTKREASPNPLPPQKTPVRPGKGTKRKLQSPSTPGKADDPEKPGSAKKRRKSTSATPLTRVGSPSTLLKPPMTERQQMALLMQMTDPQKQPPPVHPVEEPSPRSRLQRKNERGETPLHVACIKGDLKSASSLIDQGADVNATDHAGWTPLHEACNHGYPQLVSLLIRSEAKINVRGMDGDTPLHDATVNGHIEVVKILLEKGADPSLANDKGATPTDTCKNPDISKLLKLHFHATSPARHREPKTKALVQEPKTPVSKSQEPKPPISKAQELKTPISKAQELKTPVSKAQELKTPVSKTQELKTPVSKAQGKTQQGSLSSTSLSSVRDKDVVCSDGEMVTYRQEHESPILSRQDSRSLENLSSVRKTPCTKASKTRTGFHSYMSSSGSESDSFEVGGRRKKVGKKRKGRSLLLGKHMRELSKSQENVAIKSRKGEEKEATRLVRAEEKEKEKEEEEEEDMSIPASNQKFVSEGEKEEETEKEEKTADPPNITTKHPGSPGGEQSPVPVTESPSSKTHPSPTKSPPSNEQPPTSTSLPVTHAIDTDTKPPTHTQAQEVVAPPQLESSHSDSFSQQEATQHQSPSSPIPAQHLVDRTHKSLDLDERSERRSNRGESDVDVDTMTSSSSSSPIHVSSPLPQNTSLVTPRAVSSSGQGLRLLVSIPLSLVNVGGARKVDETEEFVELDQDRVKRVTRAEFQQAAARHDGRALGEEDTSEPSRAPASAVASEQKHTRHSRKPQHVFSSKRYFKKDSGGERSQLECGETMESEEKQDNVVFSVSVGWNTLTSQGTKSTRHSAAGRSDPPSCGQTKLFVGGREVLPGQGITSTGVHGRRKEEKTVARLAKGDEGEEEEEEDMDESGSLKSTVISFPTSLPIVFSSHSPSVSTKPSLPPSSSSSSFTSSAVPSARDTLTTPPSFKTKALPYLLDSLKPSQNPITLKRSVSTLSVGPMTSTATSTMAASTKEIAPHDRDDIALPPKKRYIRAVQRSVVIQQRREKRGPPPLKPTLFDSFLMCGGDYRLKEPISPTNPKNVYPPIHSAMCKLFSEQEGERVKLKAAHTTEQDRLLLCLEQELVRSHQRVFKTHTTPISVCAVLLERMLPQAFSHQSIEAREPPAVITGGGGEGRVTENKERVTKTKDPTSPPLSHGDERLLSALVQDVWDKFLQLKLSLVSRQKHEAEALWLLQQSQWTRRMEEHGLLKSTACPDIPSSHLPMVLDI